MTADAVPLVLSVAAVVIAELVFAQRIPDAVARSALSAGAVIGGAALILIRTI